MDVQDLESYLDDIASQPAVLRELFPQVEGAVAAAFTKETCEGWESIITTGCGDSRHAGVAAELALARLTGLRVRAQGSMDTARYQSLFLDGTTAVLAVSVSGEAARTVEAATLARAAGAQVIAVTANAGSRLAQASSMTLATQAPRARSHGPDARTFMMSLLTILLAGVRIGEVRGRLSADEALGLRVELLNSADLMEAAQQAAAAAEAAARDVGDSGAFVAVGAGPNLGTALFTAAKILEGSGDFAWAQDAEEWAHEEYWIREFAMPTILFSAPGLAHSRIVEQAETMQRAGRRVVTVAQADDPVMAFASHSLVVPSGIREMFSPLVYAVAGELLSYYLVERKHLSAFAVTRDDGSVGPSNLIRQGVIEASIDDLRPLVSIP